MGITMAQPSALKTGKAKAVRVDTLNKPAGPESLFGTCLSTGRLPEGDNARLIKQILRFVAA